MKLVNRIDLGGAIKRAELTPQGGLRVLAHPTRTGILLYRNEDGSIRRELRHPNDVFAAASLETLKHAPLTDLHPEGRVDTSNYTQLAKGHVADDPRESTELPGHVECTILVQDAELIRLIDEGERKELSCGYTVSLDETPGEWEGQPYDARQVGPIVYNHVACGPSGWGRAGPTASLRVDGERIDGLALGEHTNTKKGTKIMTKPKKNDTRTDAAPEKTVKELARERAQILVLALRHGVKTIHVDGKDVDVVDADDVDAVLMALAKKTFPNIDLAPLELTSEQLLALASQIAGMKPAAKESPLAPPPEDGDMPPDDEEEEPIDGKRRGDRRDEDPFAVLDRLDGHGERSAITPRKRGRSYQDAHEEMERRLRAGRHYRAPRQDGAPSHDSITDLAARLDARLASYARTR